MIMPDYETLDVIADIYNPLLAVTALGMIVLALLRQQKVNAKYQVISILLAMIAVYCFFFLDKHFEVWSSVGLDYSTHTAFALVFVVHLAWFTKSWLWWLAGSFFLYLALMKFQEYHSWGDIITTGVPVSLTYMFCLFYLCTRQKK